MHAGIVKGSFEFSCGLMLGELSSMNNGPVPQSDDVGNAWLVMLGVVGRYRPVEIPAPSAPGPWNIPHLQLWCTVIAIDNESICCVNLMFTFQKMYAQRDQVGGRSKDPATY
jgi:hypothetical protein